MSQSELPFFDSAEAATRHSIEASGKSLKEVASALWPDRNIEAARTLLANCLNENRPERLTCDQHAFVAIFCARFDWLYYVCHRAGHSQPTAQTPEDQKAQVEAAILETVDRFEVLVRQFKQLAPRKGRAA